MITQTGLYPPQPLTTRGQSTFLSYDAKHHRLAYAAGKSVVVRSADPAQPGTPVQFTKHTSRVTAAAFSASGFYVASGDESGQVKIWDVSPRDGHEPPLVKSEFHVLGGAVKAIAWDADSARVIAVGDGKEKFGHCFSWDLGNSIGEIQGHAETVNCVDIRRQRPYRAATVGDDKAMVFFAGPPFKFDKSLRNNHTNSVRAVRFLPDGQWLVSAGLDRMVVLYDGKTGEVAKRLENAHDGGIFDVQWFADSQTFVTASADNTVKRWTAALEPVQVYGSTSAKAVEAQKVGVAVTLDHVVALSLNGDLAFYPHESGEPHVVKGHQSPLTSVRYDERLVSGGSDGTLFEWTLENGTVTPLATPFGAHSNYVAAIAGKAPLVTAGWDDKIKFWLAPQEAQEIAVAAQPKAVCIGKYTTVLYERKIEVYDSATLVAETELAYTALSADCRAALDVVYVTNETKLQVEVYRVGAAIEHLRSLPPLRAAPTLVRVAPNGLVAVAESTGKYTLYDEKDAVVTTRWAFHSSRVHDAQWLPDLAFLVSGGLDCSVLVYLVAKKGKVLRAALTHQTGVAAVAWLAYGDNAGTVVSAGLDAALKTWKVDLSAYA